MECFVTATKIVSTFQKSADVLQAIQDRKEKKKRKKEKDFEKLVEGRLLHKSLIEGRDECQKVVVDRHQQYGMPFDVGDAPATSMLKDVVISLQGDILQALQMGLVSESAAINIGHLIELSITNRQGAIWAMDELCQRLTASAPAQRPSYMEDSYEFPASPFMSPVSPSSGPIHPQMYRMRSNDSAESLPMASTASSYQAAQCPQPLQFQRIRSIRQPSEGGPNRVVSQISHGSLYSDWGGQRYRYPEIEADIRRRMVREEEEEEEVEEAGFTRGRERARVPSVHDSAVGSANGSKHKPSDSVGSSAAPHIRRQGAISDRRATGTAPDMRQEELSNRAASVTSTDPPENFVTLQPDGQWARTSSITSSVQHSPMPPQRRARQDDEISSDSEDDESSFSSHTRAGSKAHSARTETAEDRARAMYAPEVVTKEFESMLLHSGRPSVRGRPSSQTDIHPALREPFQMPALLPPAGIGQPWLPLPRPARHNNYHGFCKGAWQIRKNIREGLSISMIPNASGTEVPHWKCKLCEYRSKGASLQSANVLPDEVFFHARSNIRYRWLFLAKSHLSANVAHTKPEGYSYGCMFCAAQGRSSGAHEKLDGLMMHIVSKHKTAMMTPETRENTKAIVGGVADKAADWDVNLPETRKLGAMSALGEFTVSAVTGLSKYN